MNRVIVPLDASEYAALVEMAMHELRNPADQLRHMLREELERSHSEDRGSDGFKPPGATPKDGKEG